MLGAIAKADVERTWVICAPLLKKSLKNGESNYTLEDIKDRILAGVFQLWAWVENNTIIACAVTTVFVYPAKKICSVMYVGGYGLKFWKENGVGGIENWAKLNGCSDIEGYVRKGWLRVLPQWRTAWITIRRSL